MRTRRIIVAVVASATLCAGLYLFHDDPPAAVDADGGGSQFSPPGAGGADLYTQLAAHLERHPRDARAWAIFARLSFERERYVEAAAAYAHALEHPGKVAQDPLVWCEYADAVAMANGGRLAGRPRELIDRALLLNPRHPRALEMAGSAEVERGDYTGALRYWEAMLDILPPDSAQYRDMVNAVGRARERAMR